MLREQWVFGPDQYPAAATRREIASPPNELHPIKAMVFRRGRLIAFRADAGVIDLVCRNMEIINAFRRFDDVVVHLEDELVALFIAQTRLVVVAVGAQMPELRMFERVSQMGWRLNVRHNLNEPLQAIVDDLLQLGGGERTRRPDDGIGRILELVFKLERDHVDFEPGGPIEVTLQSLDSILMMLGVLVQETQLQFGPVLDRRDGRQQTPARVRT